MTEVLDRELEKLAERTEVLTSERTVTERVRSHMDQSDQRGQICGRRSRSTKLPSSKDLATEGNHPGGDGLVADDDEMDAVVVDPHEHRFVLISTARHVGHPWW